MKSIFKIFTLTLAFAELCRCENIPVRNSSADFNVTFTNKSKAENYFKSNIGLTVVGSNYYCAVNDDNHLLYDTILDGEPPKKNQKGLIIKMDNSSLNTCSSNKVIYSAGHLSSV